MIIGKTLARRTFLRGAGAAVALPFFDAMAPALASSSIPGKKPVRMGWVYVPNGIDMRYWNPDHEGAWRGDLPATLKPLDGLRGDITLLSNLTQNNGRALLDGAGDHGRCCGAYLTGVHPRKSAVDIRAGISCDQIVANEVGAETRFPSLEIGIEDARQAGNCDSGYSCAYTNNLAWRGETQPLPPILNPRVLFERLFGKDAHLSPEARAQRNRFRKSILDFVSEDTRKLRGDLGPTDQRKLDEYLSSIREIETQIEKTENDNEQIDPGLNKPYGVPADFAEHFKLMTDMLTVAMQADMSRVFTFLVTREGSSRPYREIGIPDGHHPLTHHQNRPERMEESRQDQPLSRRAAREVGYKAEGHTGRRLDAAGQFDDHLRRRPLRRQPPYPRRPANVDDRQRRWHDQDGPSRDLPQGNADLEPVLVDDGPDGRPRRALRRLYGPARRAGSHLAGSVFHCCSGDPVRARSADVRAFVSAEIRSAADPAEPSTRIGNSAGRLAKRLRRNR